MQKLLPTHKLDHVFRHGFHILILQATFEDDLIEDAKAKKHSLTCEAVEVGAKVRQLMLCLRQHTDRKLCP